MATKKADADKGSGLVHGKTQAELKQLHREGNLPSGVCRNYNSNEPYYECTAEDEAVANGEISRSADGQTVVNLVDGSFVRQGGNIRVAPAIAVDGGMAGPPPDGGAGAPTGGGTATGGGGRGTTATT